MNRLLTLALLALLLLACKKDKASDPTPVQPQLPPATQTGANTFACYVNGNPFIQEKRTGSIVGTQIGLNSSQDKWFIQIDAAMREVDTLFPYSIFVTVEFLPDTSKTYSTNDLRNKLWGGGADFVFLEGRYTLTSTAIQVGLK